MKLTTKYISAAFAMVLGAGCSFLGSQSANYCDDAAFDNCMNLVDAPIDGPPMGCVADPAKCTGATLVCEPVADVCVECTAASAAACVGMAPVCGMDNSCRGCTAHTECGSEVCLPDGSCAAEAEVAYVNGGNGMGTTCTKTAPCKTVTVAVATPKVIVKVTGAVVEPAKIVITSARRLFGESKATVRASGGMKTIFEIPTGGHLAVHQLDVGGTVNLKPDRCYQIPSSETGQLTLVGGKVSNCVIGVESLSSGGTVTVTGATVSGNTGAGITASGGTVTVTGSTVSGNTGGGLELSNSGFTLVNNFIVKNGGPGSAFGGIQFRTYIATLPALHEMSFNTIANNQATSGLDSGITCSAVTATLATASNIIFGNSVTATAVATNCSYTYSAFSPTLMPGVGNLVAVPTFIDSINSNFHLKDAGTNVGIANPTTANDPGATLTTDVDGEVRPQGGGARDLGADEIP